MKRSKLKNKYNKFPTEENKSLYKKTKELLCKSPLKRKEKLL